MNSERVDSYRLTESRNQNSVSSEPKTLNPEPRTYFSTENSIDNMLKKSHAPMAQPNPP